MNKKPYILCFCNDCKIEFLVKKQSQKTRFFCPECGENIVTRVIKTIWFERPFGYRSLWTKEEDQQIVDLINAGKDYNQVAAALYGRTYDSVRRRITRLRESGEFNELCKSSLRNI